jgi:hypothetical protein
VTTGPFEAFEAAKRIEAGYNEATQLVPFEMLATGRAWMAFALADGKVSTVNGHVEVYATLALALRWQRVALTERDAGFLKILPTPTSTGEMAQWLSICRRNRESGFTPYERDGALEWRQ